MNENHHTIESRIELGQNLGQKTTLGIGGAAEYYFVAETDRDLIAACRWAKGRAIPIRVLSGGSNLVISDSGVTGLTIDFRSRGVQFESVETGVCVTAASGENWDAFVQAVAQQGYYGLECLSGIPGRVGATPIQNVGAYGQDVAQSITHVDAYDLENDKIVRLSAGECEFAYRSSRFRSRHIGRFIILSVCYALEREGLPQTRNTELARLLSEMGVTQATAMDLRTAVLALRRSKSMVHDPADPWTRSCGSFFVNPAISENKADEIRLRNESGHVPIYPLPSGRAKIAAAWLIEHSGFYRGYREGAVGLSGKHSLAIVAFDQATARSVCELARKIQDAVLQQFGIELFPEPVFWGFDKFQRGLPTSEATS